MTIYKYLWGGLPTTETNRRTELGICPVATIGGTNASTGWWLNHPFEKYARQNGNHLPQFSG